MECVLRKYTCFNNLSKEVSIVFVELGDDWFQNLLILNLNIKCTVNFTSRTRLQIPLNRKLDEDGIKHFLVFKQRLQEPILTSGPFPSKRTRYDFFEIREQL